MNEAVKIDNSESAHTSKELEMCDIPLRTAIHYAAADAPFCRIDSILAMVHTLNGKK